MASSDSIRDSENLTRFLLSKRWFSALNERVKGASFIPYPHKELSVSRTDGIDSSAIWQLGNEVVQRRSDLVSLHARADISASDIRKEKLQITKDEPPPRHANLIGWPDEKAKQKDIANELAAQASLVLR